MNLLGTLASRRPVGSRKTELAGGTPALPGIVPRFMSVMIPTNNTATVFIPAASAEPVTEGGKPAAQSSGVKFLRRENGRAVFKIESGAHTFGSRF